LNMRFRVGQKVRIREDLETYKDYDNVGFVSGMMNFKGKITRIVKDVTDDWTPEAKKRVFELDVDNGSFSWSELMLIPISFKRIEMTL